MPNYLVGSDKTYTTLQGAIDAINAIGNLAGTGVHRVVVDGSYNAGTVSGNLTATGSDASNYVEFDCSDAESSFSAAFDINFLPITNTVFNRAWLAPSASHSSTYLFSNGGNNVIFQNRCRIYNPSSRNCTAVFPAATFRNWQLLDSVVTGFTGSFKSACQTVNTIARCTIHNCYQGIRDCLNVIDTVVTGHTTTCFNNNTNVSYCASADATATGTGALTSIDPATAFVNAAAGDFTLAALSPLIGAGSTGNNIGYDQVTGQEEAPAITSHPTATTIIEGDAGSFTVLTVGFTGTPTPSVQWQRDNAGDGNYVDVPGLTGSSITIYGDTVTRAADNGDRYRAAVTNSQGTVYSNPTTLPVILAPFTIVSGPSSIQRGGSYVFRVRDTNIVPTPENTDAYYSAKALDVTAVANAGNNEYDISVTVPALLAMQYSESVNGWTIQVGDQVAMPWETAFLPPDGWEYVVLESPDTTNSYSAFFGYAGDAPATGWQWEKQTHTNEGDANYPSGLRVEPEGVAGYMALEAMPLATQTMQHRLIEPDGTLWPLATLTFDIGDDETPNDTPDQSVTGVEPESTVTFTEFTVAGLGAGITVSYTISNGEFAVNSGGGYGSYDGTAKNVQNGYAVTVRHESAAITGGTPGIKTTTLNQNGLLAQFTSTTRAAIAPTITEQPNGSAATSVGAAVTINAAVSNYASLQWRSNGVAIPGATSLPLSFTPAAVGSYSLDFVATSSEGASITSSAHVVTAIALATRIVIPAGVVTGRGVSMAGQTVTVNVWADDGGKAGEFLYSTSVALASSGATNLDSNQNGDAGTTRWYSFPSATGGNSEAFFQTTVQAIP